MKKFLALLSVIWIMFFNSGAYALEELNSELNASNKEIKAEQPPLTVHNDAPVWAEYVAPKYRNPRSDFSKKAAISELAVGIVLTELILTAPIGIPMVVHGTTKVKMVSYNNRKNIFDERISEAQLIQDDNKRKAEYKKILKRCSLKESTRKHYAKKAAKAQKKNRE